MEINWAPFFDQIINGVTVGSFYALIALGYTMVYGVLKMINFAHSEIFMMGSYTGLFTLTILTNLGLYERAPLLVVIVTFLAGMTGAALTGVTVERLAYRPLRRAARLAPLISAIGASIFLQELVRLLPNLGEAVTGISIGGADIFPQAVQDKVVSALSSFGGNYPKAYPGILNLGGIDIGEVYISYGRMIVVVTSIAMMAFLYFLVMRTRLGKAMRAVSEDKDTAALMGVNVDQVISRTFLIGSALAGIAGVMVGMYYLQIKVTMGFIPGIKAFTAAVLGGIGNIPGAMLGGYTLGLAESLGVLVLPAVYKDIVAFSLLVLTLVFKPTGILGEAVSGKRM
ncbi:MAG: branched-chain amino acid ABC transporter permease [Chloroflexi bacterium]|nr:branched-chain amino acid ABC transporter permease [Chloroflexota bacterium]